MGFGRIEKIVCVTVPKNPPVDSIDAMVQFATPRAAIACLGEMAGMEVAQSGAIIDYGAFSFKYEEIQVPKGRPGDYTRKRQGEMAKMMRKLKARKKAEHKGRRRPDGEKKTG